MTEANETPSHGENSTNEKVGELEKLLFDFSYKWFAYHAEQRMKAFNFMILTFGLLSTAIVTCLDKGLHLVGGAVSFASMIVSLLFLALDKRNETLVSYGRDSLVSLESHFANFSPQIRLTNILTTIYGTGSLTSKPTKSRDLATIFKDAPGDLKEGRHRTVIPAFALLFFGLFFGGLVVAIHDAFSSPSNSAAKVKFCVGADC